jgi:hypothetical protein
VRLRLTGERPNLWSECTAQGANGKFCSRPSLPEAPFPICVHHAAKLVEYISKVVADQSGTKFDNVLDIFRVFDLLDGAEDIPLPPRPKNGHVYYIELDGLIKIGFSTELARRIRHYPPTTKFLAAEPGESVLEKRRHAEFAHLRHGGVKSEWFNDDPGLREHIRCIQSLADRPGSGFVRSVA